MTDNGDDSYGRRARIGYTSPPLTTEVFPYEFYQMVPAGIALAGSSQDLHQLGQVAWLGRSVKAGGEAIGGNPSGWQAR